MIGEVRARGKRLTAHRTSCAYEAQGKQGHSHQRPANNTRASVMKKLPIPLLTKSWIELDTHDEVVHSGSCIFSVRSCRQFDVCKSLTAELAV